MVKTEVFMRLNNRIGLVGSGTGLGFGLTHSLDCHVYILDGKTELALIDAGVGIEPDRIIDIIYSDGYDLNKIKYLLLTHGHADHAGGAFYFKERLGCQVIAPVNEAKFIQNGDTQSIGLEIAKKAGYYPQDYDFKACVVDRAVADGEEIMVGDIKIKVIETPGHSIGGATYLAELEAGLAAFTGDLIAHGGKISLQNIPGVSIQAYAKSVQKLEGLGIEMFLPGHLSFSMREGQQHIDKAADAFRRLGVPQSII